MLVLSYSLGLAPIDPERVVALRGLDSVRFKRPVQIGETIRVRGRDLGPAPARPASGLVTIDWKVIGGAGRTAVRAELQAIWRRAPEPSPNGAARAPGVEELSPIQDGRLLV